MINFLKNINNILYAVIFILLIVSIGWIKSCSSSNDEISILNQNVSALKDSIRYEYNKNKQLTIVSTAYIADIKQLKTLNEELYKAIKNAKQDVKVITITEVEFRDKPVYITNNIKLSDSNMVTIDWERIVDTTDFYQKIKTTTQIKIDTSNQLLKIFDKGTVLHDNILKMKLISTIRYNTELNKYESTITSPNDNIHFDIQTNIDPSFTKYAKQDKFIIGPVVGVGFSGNISPIEVNKQFSWYVGLGVIYRLYGF